MTVAFEQLEAEAFKLDRNERLILGQELLVSALDQEETVIEKAWYDEAERGLKHTKLASLKHILPIKFLMKLFLARLL